MTAGIVSAGHQETAQAALDLLAAGGNAFDAIVGAAFASCAAEPVLTSLGGGGFLLAHNAGGLERLYDFFVETPLKHPDPQACDFFPIHADFGTASQEFHIGKASVATPGMIAGLFAIHQDLGRLPMQEVMQPAIDLCQRGITINPFQEYLFQVIQPIYSHSQEAKEVFSNGTHEGVLVRTGDHLTFPDLARTLEALAREGSDLFYRGELAKRLVEQFGEGGCLTAPGLERFRVEKRRPYQFHYQGNRLLTNPPPSSGGILIAFTLGLLESAAVSKTDFLSREELIRLAHAMEWTNQARKEITEEEPDWTEAAKLLFREEFIQRYRKSLAGHPQVSRGTTHLNVIDEEGNVASMSLSNGEGCGHVLKGTGIMLNNMLGEEDLNPMGFHQWKTGVRMSSMMSPTLLFQKDGTMVATGSGGSNRIRTAIVQVLRNMMEYGATVEQAVKAPRIHYERGLLSVEPGLAAGVVQVLTQEFPKHHLWEEKNLFFGGVHTVARHSDGKFEGAGDSRRAGICLKL